MVIILCEYTNMQHRHTCWCSRDLWWRWSAGVNEELTELDASVFSTPDVAEVSFIVWLLLFLLLLEPLNDGNVVVLCWPPLQHITSNDEIHLICIMSAGLSPAGPQRKCSKMRFYPKVFSISFLNHIWVYSLRHKVLPKRSSTGDSSEHQ